jgi:hypothetical protein
MGSLSSAGQPRAAPAGLSSGYMAFAPYAHVNGSTRPMSRWREVCDAVGHDETINAKVPRRDRALIASQLRCDKQLTGLDL